MAHDKKQWYIDKRDGVKRDIIAGTIEPKEYRICAFCRECYPYYNGYVQSPNSSTCPEWLTGKSCGKEYRKEKHSQGPRQSRSMKDAHYTKMDKGACRKSLCSVKPYCVHISACLDKEIAKPGTLPLKPDGSCKVPNSGVDVTRAGPNRLHAQQYGAGLAHTV